MAKNLVVFDIDGTVTESELHHLEAFETGLNKMGIETINTDWSSYEHMTDHHIFKVNYVNQFEKIPHSDEIVQLQNHIMKHLEGLPKMEEKKGAANFIQQIWDSDQWDLAFATGSLYESAIKKLRDSQIKFKPSIVIGSNHIESREGLVNTAIKAAKRMFQVSNYASILSCGDGLWDLKTANNLNIPFLGVGSDNEIKLQQAGAIHHICDWENIYIEELENYLK